MGSGAGGRRTANMEHSLGNPLDRLLPGQWGRTGRAAVKADQESQLLLLASARIATGSTVVQHRAHRSSRCHEFHNKGKGQEGKPINKREGDQCVNIQNPAGWNRSKRANRASDEREREGERVLASPIKR